MQIYLAIDLGAGSGRLVAGVYDGTSLKVEEVNRFSNNGVNINGSLHWDTPRLFLHITEGIRLAVEKYGDKIVSIAADSWGCDFALVDSQGNILGGHHQYRDPRSEGMQDVLDGRMAQEEVYNHTGVQPAFYNSSLHLLSEQVKESPCLDVAENILFTPDLLAFWLSGVRSNERTIASTSQLYNPFKRDWAWEVIDAIGLPRRMFGEITSSGTVLGNMNDSVKELTEATSDIKVVASAGHDTACAVAGLPMERGGLWLSSGTWSILGVELDNSLTTPEAYAAGLSNEGGVNKSTRLLHNVSGLWIIQECRRHWLEHGEEMGYAELARLAEEAQPFTAFIDPNDPVFSSPGNMPKRIKEYCRRTGQTIPETKGSILRIATESLALKYRQVVDSLKEVTGREFAQLNAGGGGIQNLLLMQAAADALGIPVVSGPIEATSCGNIITQMVAVGEIKDINEGRKLIKSSIETSVFMPKSSRDWQKPYEKFLELVN